jgi:BlaI family transcriptional regulator, penicillinase repressor
MTESPKLSAREREVLDALHRTGRATVSEIVDAMPAPATYAAVRAALRALAAKGQVRHEYDGPRYVYEPTVARDQASTTALAHLVGTFFDGSVRKAMAALLDLPGAGLPRAQRERLARLIEDAEREGR